MIFLDTSFLLALAMPSDGLHNRAKQWSEKTGGPFLTTEYVLVEFVNALSAASQRARAHSLLASVGVAKGVRVVPSSPDLFGAGLRLHASRLDQEWSLTDCISFVVMERENCAEALTYDHHFQQAGFRPLLRTDPPQRG